MRFVNETQVCNIVIVVAIISIVLRSWEDCQCEFYRIVSAWPVIWTSMMCGMWPMIETQLCFCLPASLWNLLSGNNLHLSMDESSSQPMTLWLLSGNNIAIVTLSCKHNLNSEVGMPNASSWNKSKCWQFKT